MFELMLVRGVAQSVCEDVDVIALVRFSDLPYMEVFAKDWRRNEEFEDEDIAKFLYDSLVNVKEDVELLVPLNYFDEPIIDGTVADLNGMGCNITIKEVDDDSVDFAEELADDEATEILLSH